MVRIQRIYDICWAIIGTTVDIISSYVVWKAGVNQKDRHVYICTTQLTILRIRDFNTGHRPYNYTNCVYSLKC